MTRLLTSSPRAARLLAPLFVALATAAVGCSGDALTDPDTSAPPAGAGSLGAPEGPAFATSFRGGIPFGHFAQPTSTFGARYNGGMRNIDPSRLLSELKAIKEQGGKVVLNLAGAPPRYTDGSGNFSLSLWKSSMDRFRDIDFSSYIQDGTVVGNFLIDEPNDPANWKNGPISASTVEEMARYSKSRWPGLPAIARVRPEYFTGTYHYLDAAWAQYHSRFGDPAKFVSANIAAAKNKGLALVVGFNILKGNDGSPLTANQIESWGSALMADPYSCAFLSWTYDDQYVSRSDIGQALGYLSGKAANRSTKTCRGTNGQTSGTPTDTSTAPAPSAPLTSTFPLAVDGIWSENGRDYVRLKWSGARTSTVDFYRNGVLRKTVDNDGKQTFIRPLGTLSSYTYRVCERGSSICSNTVSVTFK
jgi:hypothetical protein